ncbi:MAG TPA: hypothetical protein PK306_06470 [Aquabacterium sp.]|jgi:hypothetical protein|uniref:hypothetical protein n=1 Tax=Comamonadaceae TaxID=80864 RepID=UPI001FCC4BF4|nr:hypothetical protein [Delftia lacustris]BDE73439.1 hypothetical protein HQS1_45630 [Delftia lacustris]HQC95334.1 hypothetical protein [Aquabacterium sp.]
MTTHLTAMATALAVRNACARQIDRDRPLDNLDLDAIVRRVIQSVAQCLPCADDVFDGIAQAIQAQSHCTPLQAFSQVLDMVDPARPLDYSPWRHGGWYVSEVRYPSGACGCVSRNYPDKKWRIVCDNRRGDLNAPGDVTFRSRDEAARAEQVLALHAWVELIRSSTEGSGHGA